jgi:hypothetical protein
MRSLHHNSISFAALYTWLHRMCDRCFWVKFLNSETHGERPLRDSASWVFCPFNQGLGFTECSNSRVISSVSSLCFLLNKLAIAWTVPATIVTTFNRKSFLVTMLQCPLLEVFKPLPQVTNLDASPAVSLVVLASFAIASLTHSTPDVVKRILFSWVGLITGPATKCLCWIAGIDFKRAFAFDTAWHTSLVYHGSRSTEN